MKIYPGKHQIVQTDEIISNTDIPLAYIDSAVSDYNASVIPKIPYQTASELIPYTVFNSQDVCLFDSTGTIVDNTSILQRESQDQYVYIPKDTISFNPERFNYVVTGKKQITYSSQKIYDIKVGCVDTPPTLAFAKNLIKVFGDAPRRNVAPTNIRVNSMDLSIESLINSTINEDDFVFIESADGKNYGTGSPIDINSFLDSHANVWLSVDDSVDFPISTSTTSAEFKVALPQIISSLTYSSLKSFSLDTYTNQSYTPHNIFDSTSVPILILESPKKGFIIISPKEFLNNIESNVNLFYEVLMYVYSNTYVSVEGRNEWITDKVPDYVVLNNKLVKKDSFTSQMSLARMFNLSQSEISLADISITNTSGDPITYVKYTGITSDYILFDKEPIQNYSDPEKPDGAISVFTPRQNVVYFKDMLYLIEDNIQEKISYRFENLNLIVSMSSFKSSINNINVNTLTNIVIPLTETVDYRQKIVDHVESYICCKDNIISIIKKAAYTQDNGIVIAEIKIDLIENQNKIDILDMRQRGGGLDESQEPNYELLDIGSSFGRPYRKGGTLIITMSKRFEPYEDIILKAVKKHMLAEDLPIILFE